MLKLRFTPILIFLLMHSSTDSKAQPIGSQAVDYSVHANIIYHFTKYIDWPENKKTGDFIIGIVGDSPIYDELKTSLQNKMAGNQKIVIKKITLSQVMGDYQVLFISEDESASLKKIVAILHENSVLILTEEEGLALKGSCINFIISNDHLKLEFNKSNIERRSLKIASELLKLGRVVDEK